MGVNFRCSQAFFSFVVAALIYMLIVALVGIAITAFATPFRKNTERAKWQKALNTFIVPLMVSAMVAALATLLLDVTVNLILCFFN